MARVGKKMLIHSTLWEGRNFKCFVMGDSAVRGLDSLPASSKMKALPCSVTAGVEVMEMVQVAKC